MERKRIGMRFLWIFLMAAGEGPVSAQQPLDPYVFQVGVYADDARAITCITGLPGEFFEQTVWAWVPAELGLTYITLRFDFPANLDLHSRPVFNELVTDVIYAKYGDGTVEWNMLLTLCPSGWVRVFSQQCELLDADPSAIRILVDHSMARDCTFVLNDIAVINELTVNDPACPTVSVERASWSRVKSLYR